MDDRMTILVLHGPNLNPLGRRETGIYGDASLESIRVGLEKIADELGVCLEHYQSNHEAVG